MEVAFTSGGIAVVVCSAMRFDITFWIITKICGMEDIVCSVKFDIDLSPF